MERAHRLTLWSRLGPHDKEMLRDLLHRDRLVGRIVPKMDEAFASSSFNLSGMNPGSNPRGPSKMASRPGQWR
ncbi:MAG: hypothetical protein ACE5OO_05070 [Candidatus Bathyarchaeia archaeon]